VTGCFHRPAEVISQAANGFGCLRSVADFISAPGEF
jgi:hypothetical protein